MTKRMILLDSVTQIKDFVNMICRYPNDFDLTDASFLPSVSSRNRKHGRACPAVC